MKVWILILTVAIVAVIAFCIYAYGRSSGGPAVNDDGPLGWTWSGEGSCCKGVGEWISWKK